MEFRNYAGHPSEELRVRQSKTIRFGTIYQAARSRGERSFTVVVGDVHRALGFRNRVPLVCAALKSNKFLRENHLLLKQIEGPPSGLSTTVKLTFELDGREVAGAKPRHSLWNLLGEGKEMFQALGGGEVFLKGEREDLNRPA